MPVVVRSRLRRRRLRLPRLQSLSDGILRAAGKPRAAVHLLVVGDRYMRSLNRRYRRKDRTTDVLAFPAPTPSPRAVPAFLGDLAISLPQAERQAKRAGHPVDREVAVLVIHGLLHLLGYDHERSAREADRMRRRQEQLLRRVGPLPRVVGGVR